MEIFYTSEQHNNLLNKMLFIKSIRNMLWFVFFIFTFALIGGGLLIYLSFPLIGVIVTLAAVLPFFVSLAFLCICRSLLGMIKKERYRVFRVKCSSVKKVPGSQLWRHVKARDVDEFDVFYYSSDPVESVKPGEEYEIIVHADKKYLRFGVAPVEKFQKVSKNISFFSR